MRSPFQITYSDLLREHEENLRKMKMMYPGKVKDGSMGDWTAKRKIALQEQLVKMLRAHQKNRQLNLEDLFNQTKTVTNGRTAN